MYPTSYSSEAHTLLFPYDLPGEQWEEAALDEFERLTHCAGWKPLVAKLSSDAQTGISTWPQIYLYDTSNGKVRVRFIHCLQSL